MTLISILLGILICVCGTLLFFFLKKQTQDSQLQQQKLQESQTLVLTLSQRLDQLQNQLRLNLDGNTQLIEQKIGNLNAQLEARLTQTGQQSMESVKQFNTRMDNAARVFADLQGRLGKMEEANERIFNVGKDISSLQDLLRSPKQRGIMGELLLANLLAHFLPQENFELQYAFKNNEKVDAVIKIKDRLLSIDSKFPLENFQRLAQTKDELEKKAFKKQFITDVKKHIDSISKKYILPAEGTFDFAFMYIPAENVFYELIIRDEQTGNDESLQQYALRKNIIPCSPNSFYAYIGALMHALRGEKMQQNVMDIVRQMRQLLVDLSRFKEDFEKVGYHLNHLQSSYAASEKRLIRFQDRLEQAGENKVGLEENIPVKLISNDN